MKKGDYKNDIGNRTARREEMMYGGEMKKKKMMKGGMAKRMKYGYGGEVMPKAKAN